MASFPPQCVTYFTLTLFRVAEINGPVSDPSLPAPCHRPLAAHATSQVNGSVAALRFFFTVTLDRPELARHLIFVREPRKIPVVLSASSLRRGRRR